MPFIILVLIILYLRIVWKKVKTHTINSPDWDNIWAKVKNDNQSPQIKEVTNSLADS